MPYSATIPPCYQVLKVLGQGGEGTVYAVRNRSNGDKSVMKVFYAPLPYNRSEGLRFYADRVGSNEYGLSEIRLLYDDSDQIVALEYPFIQLHRVHQRCLSYFEQVAQAFFHAYCQMQGYLMSRHEIGLTDTIASHFLLAKDGRLHFVDYGVHIESITHAWSLDRGLFGYGLAWMLSSIYNINLKLEVQHSPGYSYDRPCIYCMAKSLDIIADQHDWVRRILSEVRCHNASVLLDPEFYWQLSEYLPNRPWLPRLIIGMSNALFYARKALDMCFASLGIGELPPSS